MPIVVGATESRGAQFLQFIWHFLSRCLEPLAAHMTDILRKVDFEDYGVLYCSIIKVKVSDVR